MLRGILQLGIDRAAIGCLIVDTPEIESTHAVGLERLGHFHTLVEHFVLLRKAELRVELVTLGAVFGRRRTRPVDLEERAGDVGDAELILLQDPLGLADLRGGQTHEIFVPQDAHFHPLHSEFAGCDEAGVIKILRNLVRDHRNPEWRRPLLCLGFVGHWKVLWQARDRVTGGKQGPGYCQKIAPCDSRHAYPPESRFNLSFGIVTSKGGLEQVEPTCRRERELAEPALSGVEGRNPERSRGNERYGGSVCESNAPSTSEMPSAGFEVEPICRRERSGSLQSLP